MKAERTKTRNRCSFFLEGMVENKLRAKAIIKVFSFLQQRRSLLSTAARLNFPNIFQKQKTKSLLV